MSKLKKWMEERTTAAELADRREEGTDPGIRLFGHVIAMPAGEEMHNKNSYECQEAYTGQMEDIDEDRAADAIDDVKAAMDEVLSTRAEGALASAGRSSGLDAIVAAALPTEEEGSGSGGDEFGSSSGSNSGSDAGAHPRREGEEKGNDSGSPGNTGGTEVGIGQRNGGWDGGGSGSGSGSEGMGLEGNQGGREEGTHRPCRTLSSEQQAAADAAWELQEQEQEEEGREGGTSAADDQHQQQQAEQHQQQGQQRQQGALKKPDKIVPCPRCNSMDTKFCYYNNYNVNQPRHFCKKCQRYWTAGGTLRNVPVGSGRRKSKHALQRATDPSTATISMLTGYRNDKLDAAQLLGTGLPHSELEMQLGIGPMDSPLGVSADMRMRAQQAAFRARLGQGGLGSGTTGFDSTGCGDSSVTGMGSSLRRDGTGGEDLVSSGHLYTTCGSLGLQLEPADGAYARDSLPDLEPRMRRVAMVGRKSPYMDSLTGVGEDGSHLGLLLREEPGSSSTVLASEAREPVGAVPMLHHPSTTTMYGSPAMADVPVNPWTGMPPAGSALGPPWGHPASHYSFYGNGAWSYGYGMGWNGPGPSPSNQAQASAHWHNPGVWSGAPPWASGPGSPWGPPSQWGGPWGGMQWVPPAAAVAAAALPAGGPMPAGSSLGKRMREGMEGEGREAGRDEMIWGPKALRIEDQGEDLNRSSAWTRVGLGGASPSEAVRSSGQLRPYPSKEVNKTVDLRHMNPAAMARSMVFHES